MQGHQLLDQGKPHAGAAVPSGGGVIDLVEALEDPLLVVRVDTDAPVHHLQGDTAVAASAAHLHRAVGGTELDGIVQQSFHHLGEPLLVGLNTKVLGHLDVDFDVVPLDRGCDVLDGGVGGRSHRCRKQVKAQAVGLDHGVVEDGFDQLVQALGGDLDIPDCV